MKSSGQSTKRPAVDRFIFGFEKAQQYFLFCASVEGVLEFNLNGFIIALLVIYILVQTAMLFELKIKNASNL